MTEILLIVIAIAFAVWVVYSLYRFGKIDESMKGLIPKDHNPTKRTETEEAFLALYELKKMDMFIRRKNVHNQYWTPCSPLTSEIMKEVKPEAYHRIWACLEDLYNIKSEEFIKSQSNDHRDI